MKKLTKKELKAIQENIIPVLPPAFEEGKELLGVESGLKLNATEEGKNYNPKQMYKKYKKTIEPVNYVYKMKKINNYSGEVGVFGMFLYYCNKTISTVKAMSTAEMGLLENMKIVNYTRKPEFLSICQSFSRIAKGESTYREEVKSKV